MKQLKWFAVVALMIVAFTSCEKQSAINESDLYGYWFNQSTNEYMRILHDEKEMENGNYLGYEWKVGEKLESDLQSPSSMDYHGNGWFEWKLEDNKLTFIEMMNVSEAKGAKVYTITLSATNLVLKDDTKTLTYVKSTQPK